jgi:hypothetical protein
VSIRISRAAYLAVFVFATSAAAQPDWTGLWKIAHDPDHRSTPIAGTMLKAADLPVLTAAYQAIFEANRKSLLSGSLETNKTAKCQPPGMPLAMSIPYGGEILMTPGRVTIITEWAGDTRRIFTDGRAHPANLELTYEGHSIGHWEGRELVVDTIAISPKASLNTDGTQQSDKMHITERFREYKPGYLEISYHVEDSEAFQSPYEFKLVWMRNPEKSDYVHEYYCDNNDRDAARIENPGSSGQK